METTMRNSLILISMLALTGCVTLPPMKQIKPDLPTAWPTESTRLQKTWQPTGGKPTTTRHWMR
jgi:starvation-inducible outer membrane lipoprotein